jgi:hypothetical protein
MNSLSTKPNTLYIAAPASGRVGFAFLECAC